MLKGSIIKKISGTCVLFITILMISGCEKEQKPDHLLPEKTFIQLMAEVQVLESYENQAEDSVSVAILKDSVFSYYNATEQQFYDTEAYYQQRPEKYKVLLDSALERLNMAQARITGIEYE